MLVITDGTLILQTFILNCKGVFSHCPKSQVSLIDQSLLLLKIYCENLFWPTEQLNTLYSIKCIILLKFYLIIYIFG